MQFLMKVVIAFLFAGTAYAQSHQAMGVVKRVDPAKGVVSLKHDPVKSLNWPGMTMDFNVRDPKQLAGVKLNQQVKFEFIEENGRYVITSMR